jgi:hypothetical protein
MKNRPDTLRAAFDGATAAAHAALRARVARRPLAALVLGGLVALWAAGACVAQVRHAVTARSAARASRSGTAEWADAYRRYQDYEYVKRVGPITGPWYSGKW